MLRKIIHTHMHALLGLIISPAAKSRFPFAVRAGLCCGIPIMIGYFVGDIHAGLLATIGSFTALYGSDRPYVNRALHLAVIALLMAAVVILGIMVASHAWMAVMVVAGIAAAATFICNVMRVGPPGAYMFALACASGTGMAAGSLEAWQSGLYVLGGGLISWFAHMFGALFHRYKPEQTAVVKAALAIAEFTSITDFSRRDKMRQAAALAVDNAWVTLVNWQSEKARQDPYIKYLLSYTQQLHAIFAQAATSFLIQMPANPSLSQQAVQIAHAVRSGLPHHDISAVSILLPEPVSTFRLIKENFVLWSAPLQLALRVGLATIIAGSIGVFLGLNHAYWGMAAVVVVLNQSYGWPGTTRRAVYRIIGTLVGLILAWCILSLHPQGLWIALTVTLLQFTIEIWVVLQYGVAAIFITTNALMIAAGGRGFPEIIGLFSARALDTVIGCGVALGVFVLTVPRSASHQICAEIKNTLIAAQRLVTVLAQGTNPVTPKTLNARRNLHQHAITLQQITDAEASAIMRQQHEISPILAAVSATEILAWRLLSACWDTVTEKHSNSEASVTRHAYILTAQWLERLQQQNEDGKPEQNIAATGFLHEEINEVAKALLQLKNKRK